MKVASNREQTEVEKGGRKKKSELKRKREEGKKTAEMEGRKAPGVYTEGLAKKSIESWNRGKTRDPLTCSN